MEILTYIFMQDQTRIKILEFALFLGLALGALSYFYGDNTAHIFVCYALFIKMDALFSTVVVATADPDDFCNKVDLTINISFLVICIVTGIALMIVNGVHTAHQLEKSDHEHHIWIVYLTLVLLSIYFPLFLLTDNSQPLDCAFECDSFAKNITLQESQCNQYSNSGLRLALTVVILAVVSSLSLFLLGCKNNTKGEGVV